MNEPEKPKTIPVSVLTDAIKEVQDGMTLGIYVRHTLGDKDAVEHFTTGVNIVIRSINKHLRDYIEQSKNS